MKIDHGFAELASQKGALLRTVACLFLTYHLAAISVECVSRNTALGTTFHRPFDDYVALARLWQPWDMFTTIPHFRAIDGSLVAFDGEGHETRYGPLLPGLRPLPNDPRMYGVFLRLAFADTAFQAYNVRYLDAVCRAVRAASGKTPAKVGFELRTLQLRSIADVLRDGRIGEPHLFPFGPIACPP